MTLPTLILKARNAGSKLSKFGRSKEKRSDAKLVVLALVVNMEGFIKYSSVHQGNIADCDTLSKMIDKLSSHTLNERKAVIVLDAGIATEENTFQIFWLPTLVLSSTSLCHSLVLFDSLFSFS